MVRLKEVILTAGDKIAKARLPLFLGKDTEGRPLVYDLAEMPHLLIAGRTGTGKSVCMNAIVLSVLMTRRPDEVKMIMIDPKMLELSEYGKIPHLMHPVVKDMRKAEAILSWAVDKMEERYDLLSRARVRGITGYNELSYDEILRRTQPDDEERQRIPERMPFIIIFVDEMNDLMMTMRKEVEGHIIRLAQKSRAAGIHLVVATQKPTVDVITGLIKSNLPARICSRCPAVLTAGSYSTKWVPTSCSARATCSSCNPARARCCEPRAPTPATTRFTRLSSAWSASLVMPRNWCSSKPAAGTDRAACWRPCGSGMSFTKLPRPSRTTISIASS